MLSPLRKPQDPILSVCNILKINVHLVEFSRKKTYRRGLECFYFQIKLLSLKYLKNLFIIFNIDFLISHFVFFNPEGSW